MKPMQLSAVCCEFLYYAWQKLYSQRKKIQSVFQNVTYFLLEMESLQAYYLVKISYIWNKLLTVLFVNKLHFGICFKNVCL